jgi:hypothetical protein
MTKPLYGIFNDIGRPVCAEKKYDGATSTYRGRDNLTQDGLWTTNTMKNRTTWHATVIRDDTDIGSTDTNAAFFSIVSSIGQTVAGFWDRLFAGDGDEGEEPQKVKFRVLKVVVPDLDGALLDKFDFFADDTQHEGYINTYTHTCTGPISDKDSYGYKDIIEVTFKDIENRRGCLIVKKISDAPPASTSTNTKKKSPKSAVKNNAKAGTPNPAGKQENFDLSACKMIKGKETSACKKGGQDFKIKTKGLAVKGSTKFIPIPHERLDRPDSLGVKISNSVGPLIPGDSTHDRSYGSGIRVTVLLGAGGSKSPAKHPTGQQYHATETGANRPPTAHNIPAGAETIVKQRTNSNFMTQRLLANAPGNRFAAHRPGGHFHLGEDYYVASNIPIYSPCNGTIVQTGFAYPPGSKDSEGRRTGEDGGALIVIKVENTNNHIILFHVKGAPGVTGPNGKIYQAGPGEPGFKPRFKGGLGSRVKKGQQIGWSYAASYEYSRRRCERKHAGDQEKINKCYDSNGKGPGHFSGGKSSRSHVHVEAAYGNASGPSRRGNVNPHHAFDVSQIFQPLCVGALCPPKLIGVTVSTPVGTPPPSQGQPSNINPCSAGMVPQPGGPPGSCVPAPASGGYCESDADCSAAYTDLVCRTSDNTCVDRSTVPATTPAASQCSKTVDCRGGEKCVNGVCVSAAAATEIDSYVTCRKRCLRSRAPAGLDPSELYPRFPAHQLDEEDANIIAYGGEIYKNCLKKTATKEYPGGDASKCRRDSAGDNDNRLHDCYENSGCAD